MDSVKDGQEHHYWSLVENRRVDGGRKVVQRHVLYLGEINSSQQAAWRKTIEVFETGSTKARAVALFPEERSPAVDDDSIVRICLDQLELRRPRQWGACWLDCQSERDIWRKSLRHELDRLERLFNFYGPRSGVESGHLQTKSYALHFVFRRYSNETNPTDSGPSQRLYVD